MVETVKNKIILTKRELEVLKFISDGYTIKELATKLNIASTTVIFQRNNLREKLKAKNCANLITMAFKMQIL